MTNTNNTESRARSNAIPKVLYDVTTLGDGNVVIKQVVIPRADLPVADGKAKDVKASAVRG
jgi:hypothetical protein